jgi:cytochrome P450
MVTAPYNPLAPEFMADPYPMYRALREFEPVHWSQQIEAWVVTSFAEADLVLIDPRFSADRSKARGRMTTMLREEDSIAFPRARTMLTSDPPEHTRLRRLVSKAFTPRAVLDLEPRIQQIVDHLLDTASARGEFDLVHDFAYPLPVIVIAEMLGVPPEDRDRFKHWSDNVIATLIGRFTPKEAKQKAGESIGEFREYFEAIIADRRKRPQPDLISGLIAAEDEGQVLSDLEVFATSLLLLVAGNETTTHIISNGMHALFQNPGQFARLRDEPSLITAAVEELLRFAGPVHLTGRVAKETIELAGKTIEPGNVVVTLLAAANRDPAKFPDPDALDVARNPTDHLAFGDGIHFCLGAPLARAETRIAVSTLLRRFPNLRSLEPNPEWGGTFVIRGLKKLTVAV